MFGYVVHCTSKKDGRRAICALTDYQDVAEALVDLFDKKLNKDGNLYRLGFTQRNNRLAPTDEQEVNE